MCRAHGDEDSARRFEETAAQEVQHAFGHRDLLYPAAQLDLVWCLTMVVEGETYEYTEMYPKFRHLAEVERNAAALLEFDEQIAESREHAEQFAAMLQKAAKRFAALTKVEQRHAQHNQQALQRVQG